MNSAVFISYRRKDGAGNAGRIYDRLEHEFGREQVFMDVNAIPLGENFKKLILEKVAQCRVLLAIIGPGWLASFHDKEHDGGTKEDYVRLEVGTALSFGIPVIPILIDGARLPNSKDLPNDLKDLALKNALDVRHQTFDADIDRLVQQLKATVWQLPTLLKPTLNTEPSTSIQLAIPLINHNVAWPHPAGFGIIPWMQVIARGITVGAINKTVCLSAIFFGNNGAKLLANPADALFRNQHGQVTTFSPPVVITTSPGLINYVIGIPYYALNLPPTGGMACYPLTVIVQAHIDQKLVAESPPTLFFCSW